MDVFLIFALALGVAGIGFAGFFSYKLVQNKYTGQHTRLFNIAFLTIAGIIFLISLALTLFAGGSLADWGLVVASADLAVVLFMLAGQGYGVGFKQMDEDGVGFIRFFQLGSSIMLCLAFAPAFFAFFTYATRIR
jgi:hypothetical protein